MENGAPSIGEALSVMTVRMVLTTLKQDDFVKKVIRSTAK
jgi:hypothetical protein